MKLKLSILILISVLMLSSCNLNNYLQGEGVSYIPLEEIPVEGEEQTTAGEEPLVEGLGDELKELTEEAEEEPIESEAGVEEKASEVSKVPEGAPKITVKEKELVKLNLKATDPDGDPLTYTYSEPLDKNGEWQTKEGDAGIYKVTVTASDGKSETKQDIYIVVGSLNSPPIMETISDIMVKEGETVELAPKATDPDGDKIAFKYSGWMTSSKYKTTYEDAGIYTVKITASDGKSDVEQEVKVTVKNVNRAPIIASLSDVSVKEGDKVTITATAADPDKDEIAITYSEPLDKNGEWQTKKGDAGKYRVTVKASDSDASSEKSFFIIVESTNKAPVFEKIEPINVDEGETVVLKPVAKDPEGEKVTFSYSGWMSSAQYTTTYDDAGEHTVTITASDGVNKATMDVAITVNDVNRPPVFVFE